MRGFSFRNMNIYRYQSNGQQNENLFHSQAEISNNHECTTPTLNKASKLLPKLRPEDIVINKNLRSLIGKDIQNIQKVPSHNDSQKMRQSMDQKMLKSNINGLLVQQRQLNLTSDIGHPSRYQLEQLRTPNNDYQQIHKSQERIFKKQPVFRNKLTSTNVFQRQQLKQLTLNNNSPQQQSSGISTSINKNKFVRPYFLDKIDDIMNQSQTQPTPAPLIEPGPRKNKIKDMEIMKLRIKELENKIKLRRKDIERLSQTNDFERQSLQQSQYMNMKLSTRISESSRISPRFNISKYEQELEQSDLNIINTNAKVIDNLIQDSVRSAVTQQTSFPQQNKNHEKEIHHIYSLYFENDLQNVKDRAIQQMTDFRNRQDQQNNNLESLRVENMRLQKTLNRYKDLMNDPNLKKTLATRQKLKMHGMLNHKDTMLKLQDDTLSQVSNSIMLDNLDDINMKVMKYQQLPMLGNEPALSIQGGEHQSQTMTTAAPAFMEISKIEKFTMNWPMISKQPKPLDMIVGLLSEFKNIFKPSKCTLFIMDKGMQERISKQSKDKKKYVKRLQMGTDVIHAVFPNEDDFCGPIFKTLEESEVVVRTQKWIMIPVHFMINQKNVLVFCVQLEADLSKENEMQQLSKKMGNRTRKKLPMHLSKGWNYSDQNLIKIMVEYLLSKIEVVIYQQVLLEKNDKVDEIIKFAFDICGRKTYRQLIRGLKRQLVKLTGFQEIGILFHDIKCNNKIFNDIYIVKEFFTVSTEIDISNIKPRISLYEASKDKRKSKFIKSMVRPKLTKEQQDIENEQHVRIEDELIFPDDAVVRFPATVGITGDVFKNHGIIFNNHFSSNPNQDQLQKTGGQNPSTNTSLKSIGSSFNQKKKSNGFNSDVDNYIGVKQIKNFLIASINDYDESEQRYSMGVIQFFNKDRPISDEDQIRIIALQRFLGASVSRVKVFTGSLTVMVGLNMIMDQQSQDLANLEGEVNAHLTEIGQIMLPFEGLRKHLDGYWNELGYNQIETGNPSSGAIFVQNI
ncbi:UNKNOWN [Stylonychia lemnae]|uniref:Uncharacterized protein n=1 Tax=Stylonychia lemnae TaxID=5949 RepID=A0A077ZVB9_STYLE|nr:UNKNOWN [Stylonychia lemnae]|eukprot:CDW73584.1 UNKNOWN [Stylonychia lemnae]